MPKGLKIMWDHRTPSVSVRLITCETVALNSVRVLDLFRERLV